MTQAQERSIKRIRRLVDADCKTLHEEVKKFEVEDYERFVSVYVVMGFENDEGTVAYLARDYAHLFIGKRGGVRFPVRGRNGQYCVPFKWYSILQAVCRQRKNYFV